MTYVIPQRVLELAAKGWWIGLDLDGTTFKFEGDTWVKWCEFGDPIELMFERIRAWVAAGVPIRVVTARVDLPIAEAEGRYIYSNEQVRTCVVTGERYSDAMMVAAIQDKLVSAGLPPFPVQPHKGGKMIELWDDRTIQVVVNTGRTLTEEHEAEMTALRGKAFQMFGDL